MKYLLALFLPFVSFFTIGKPFQGFLCMLLQFTFIGWIPATIWAFAAINQHNADKRHKELIKAMQK
jgi:uncharacterized membrane protein YqaE (UPF0057 family)